MNDDINTQPADGGRNDITELRALLFATIRGVRASLIPVENARVVNELGKTLIDSGRLEVEHRRLDDAAEPTEFMAPAYEAPRLPAQGGGVLSITRHVLGR